MSAASAASATTRAAINHINGLRQNETFNTFMFLTGAFLAAYTIYSLYKQNKILSLQQQHMMMEMDKMKKDGIEVPQK